MIPSLSSCPTLAVSYDESCRSGREDIYPVIGSDRCSFDSGRWG